MDTQEQLTNVARGSAPVLEQLAAMNLDTLENSGLEESTYHLVRLAALVASDAAPVSYLVNMGPAADAEVTGASPGGTGDDLTDRRERPDRLRGGQAPARAYGVGTALEGEARA